MQISPMRFSPVPGVPVWVSPVSGILVGGLTCARCVPLWLSLVWIWYVTKVWELVAVICQEQTLSQVPCSHFMPSALGG